MNHAACSPPRKATPSVAPAPGRLIIRTCKHILDSGVFCQAAAVRGRAYCRAHLVLRVRRRRMARARRRAGILELPRLTDLRAIKSAQTQVRVALDGGHIDPGTARLLRWGLRMVASSQRLIEWQKGQTPHRGNSAVGEPEPDGRLVAMRNNSKQLYQLLTYPFDSRTYQQNNS